MKETTLDRISRQALTALFQAKPMTLLEYFPIEHDGAWVLIASDLAGRELGRFAFSTEGQAEAVRDSFVAKPE